MLFPPLQVSACRSCWSPFAPRYSRLSVMLLRCTRRHGAERSHRLVLNASLKTLVEDWPAHWLFRRFGCTPIVAARVVIGFTGYASEMIVWIILFKISYLRAKMI